MISNLNLPNRPDFREKFNKGIKKVVKSIQKSISNKFTKNTEETPEIKKVIALYKEMKELHELSQDSISHLNYSVHSPDLLPGIKDKVIEQLKTLDKENKQFTKSYQEIKGKKILEIHNKDNSIPAPSDFNELILNINALVKKNLIGLEKEQSYRNNTELSAKKLLATDQSLDNNLDNVIEIIDKKIDFTLFQIKQIEILFEKKHKNLDEAHENKLSKLVESLEELEETKQKLQSKDTLEGPVDKLVNDLLPDLNREIMCQIEIKQLAKDPNLDNLKKTINLKKELLRIELRKIDLNILPGKDEKLEDLLMDKTKLKESLDDLILLNKIPLFDIIYAKIQGKKMKDKDKSQKLEVLESFINTGLKIGENLNNLKHSIPEYSTILDEIVNKILDKLDIISDLKAKIETLSDNEMEFDSISMPEEFRAESTDKQDPTHTIINNKNTTIKDQNRLNELEISNPENHEIKIDNLKKVQEHLDRFIDLLTIINQGKDITINDKRRLQKVIDAGNIIVKESRVLISYLSPDDLLNMFTIEYELGELKKLI